MFSNPKVKEPLYYVNRFTFKIERVFIVEVNKYGFSVDYAVAVKILPKSAFGTRLFLTSNDAFATRTGSASEEGGAYKTHHNRRERYRYRVQSWVCCVYC